MKKYSVAHIKSFYNDQKQKNDSKLPFFHRRIIRPTSFYLTVPFLYFGFSANFVTFLSLIFAVIGNMGLAFGTFDSMRLAVLLIFIAIELDFVDGNIARYHKEANQYGAFLDGSFGVLMYTIMPFCLGIGISNNKFSMDSYIFPIELSIIIGASLSILYIFNNYIQWRYKAQLSSIAKTIKLNTSSEDIKISETQPPIKNILKNILNLLNSLNSNILIPSLALLFFKMPNILLCIFIFVYLSSSIIMIAKIYRKAFHNLNLS